MATYPPGPTEPPALQLARWIRSPVAMMDDCARRFGETFTFRFAGIPPFVLFSNPAAIKDIFSADPEDAHAGEANNLLRSVLGENSLLLLDGKRHLRERKMMMPPFHGERMREYGDVMRDATRRRMETWPRGTPFSLHTETQAITLEVILRAVFGLDGGDLARMRDLLTRYTDAGTSRLGTMLLMVTPPDYAEKIFTFGMDPLTLGGRSLDVSRFLPWTPIVRAQRDVDAALFAEVANRRRAGADTRNDVLSMLLSARDEEGKPMTDQGLRDEMMTLLLAGHETTATTLAWTVHFILRHADVLHELKRELREHFGDGPINVEHIPKLDYLDAIIKESMRLMPIISLVGRRLKKPMRIGGHDLPVSAGAVACIHLTHRRPDLYPSPTRFDPARFVGLKPSPYEFFPFGGGTRRCLGMAFANYEMKIILAEIFSHVSLRAAPGDDVVPVRRGITLAPKGGVRVIAA